MATSTVPPASCSCMSPLSASAHKCHGVPDACCLRRNSLRGGQRHLREATDELETLRRELIELRAESVAEASKREAHTSAQNRCFLTFNLRLPVQLPSNPTIRVRLTGNTGHSWCNRRIRTPRDPRTPTLEARRAVEQSVTSPSTKT